MKNLPKLSENQITAPTAAVIYGTTSGNSEIIAEAITQGLNESSITTILKPVETAKISDIEQHDLIVLISSTYNEGELQDYFVPFHDELAKHTFLDKPMVVVGLGDSENYEVFCGAADILMKLVSTIKAKLVNPVVKIDGDPYSYINEMQELGKTLAGKLKTSIYQ